jgi:hypothetical protein
MYAPSLQMAMNPRAEDGSHPDTGMPRYRDGGLVRYGRTKKRKFRAFPVSTPSHQHRWEDLPVTGVKASDTRWDRQSMPMCSPWRPVSLEVALASCDSRLVALRRYLSW